MKDEKFSDRFNLDNIKSEASSCWQNMPEPLNDEYLTELYNEKNFFYDFVHNVLYDSGKKNNIIRHYERREAYCSELVYEVKVIAHNLSLVYRLRLKSLVLNLYSTGTGILMFYVENNQYNDFEDILRINQFGRRMFPPYLTFPSGVAGAKTGELADYISITGLDGPSSRYFEDFLDYNPASETWKACRIIRSLIEDLSPELEIKPVIDDRMHVVCWVGDDDRAGKVMNQSFILENKDEWYRLLFVDSGYCTCQNQEMKKKILDAHNYSRWQNEGSIFGISRYSMVFLSKNDDFCRDVLLRIFRTMYARMVELSLIQRASILKFSDEVTHLSGLKEEKPSGLADKISDFYREYIRFVNQIYFREVTAQEQGIEMYDMIQEKMKISDQVKDLDNEISELHQYAILLEDKFRNNNISLLSMIGAIFIIPSFLTGFLGMNLFNFSNPQKIPAHIWIFTILGIILSPLMAVLYARSTKKKHRTWYLILSGVFLLPALIFTFIYIINKYGN